MDRAHGDFRDDGAPRRRSTAPPDALKDMRTEVGETAAGFGGYAPVERLGTVGNDLPRGDRAGIAKMAALARQQYPDDSLVANQVFRRDLTQQYAGRDMLARERQAIVTAGAGGVDNVIEAWGSDLGSFDQPLWATMQGRQGQSGWDPDAFTPEGRARMKEKYDQRMRDQPGDAGR